MLYAWFRSVASGVVFASRRSVVGSVTALLPFSPLAALRSLLSPFRNGVASSRQKAFNVVNKEQRYRVRAKRRVKLFQRSARVW